MSPTQESILKLLGHRPGLPEKVVSFHVVPLDPAYKAGLTGHVPATGRPFLVRGNLDDFSILDKDVR